MTGQVCTGFLQLLSPEITNVPITTYPLPQRQEVVIGRDPSCQIALRPNHYLNVSRRHATIRPVQFQENGTLGWEICDLKSVNGTFINGQYLRGCRKLFSGDRIRLGQDGPQFLFESLHQQ